MNFNFKNESGILLRGGCAIAIFIGLGIGMIFGLIFGAFSGEWYIALACGFLLLINIAINLISFIINKIKMKLMLKRKNNLR